MNATSIARARRLRIALVLPGGISFGAYEAGVASSLLQVVRESRGTVVVDAIVGASCGAVTGYLLALALRHENAARWIEDFWVERASLAWMLPWTPWMPPQERPWAPLSTASLEAWVTTILDEARGPAVQDDQVWFVTSLANLHGVDVRVPVGIAPRFGVDEAPIRSFRDARAFRLADDREVWQQALRATLASSAHPCGFASVALPDGRRDRDDDPLPPAWFTDGGTVDNEPVGLAIDAVLEPGCTVSTPSGDERMLLVVHPGNRSGCATWARRDQPPSFVESGLRALEMFWAGPSTADDLRRIAAYNERVRARVELESQLSMFEANESISRDLIDRATGTQGRLPAHLLLVGPHDRRTLEGARFANVRGLMSRRARESDFRHGASDFVSAWYGDASRALDLSVE